ncbi:MAG: GxxExxY protein [Bacteroidia bacterium]|nr:GxxExxY protein [Bacteroidia bacterium]
MTQTYVNQLSYEIVGAAIEVHRNLGPGLLESVYEHCLLKELINKGLEVKTQVWLPVNYKGELLEQKFKLDMLVNDLVIVELKAVEAILPVHKAQLITYLKLAEKPKGLLLNFHTDNISKNLVPLVSEHFASLPFS